MDRALRAHRVDLDEGDAGTSEPEVRLDQIVRSPGDRLFYTYDFGDGWEHTIRLETAMALDGEHPPAACTGGRMACPLEDVGGVGIHHELIAEHRHDPTLWGLNLALSEIGLT